MAGINNIKLPKIDTEQLNNADYTKKIANYLLSLEENMRYMFGNIDDENVTQRFIDDLTVQHLKVTNGDNSIIIEPKDGLQMLKGRKPVFGFDILTGEAFFEGKITASSGNIGGWEISENGLISTNGANIMITINDKKALQIAYDGLNIYNELRGENEHLGSVSKLHDPNVGGASGTIYAHGLDAEFLSLGYLRPDYNYEMAMVYCKQAFSSPLYGSYDKGFTFLDAIDMNGYPINAADIYCNTVNGVTPGTASFANKAAALAPNSSAGNSVYVSINNNFRPTTDLGGSCGTELGRWSSVWSINGVIQTSDENQKNTIENLDERYINFAKLIQAKKYKMNDGTSGRVHTGFIAQDIEKLMVECGITSNEFAGFVKAPIYSKMLLDEEGNETDQFDTTSEVSRYEYALRYDEFIPLLFARISKIEEALIRNNIV